jgi:hypothetical protein
MTLDDTSGYKSRHFRETIQEISLDSVILPNSRTANRFPDVPETGHGERVPDYRGPFTVTINRMHERGHPGAAVWRNGSQERENDRASEGKTGKDKKWRGKK